MRAAPPQLPPHLEAYPGIVFLIDSDSRILARNAAARDIADDAATFDDVLDADSRAKWHTVARTGDRPCTAELLLAAPPLRLRSFFVSPPADGARMIVELPREDGTERLHDTLTELNSELVNAQREINKQKAQLQDALTSLRDSMADKERLATELQRVMRSRERFFSAMSHELRTPLTAVLGYDHLLLDGVAGELNDKQRNFIERTRAAAQHLNSLLDDILDLAKLESGTLELSLEQADIASILAGILDTLGPTADAAGSAIHLDVTGAPGAVTTDVRALRQILVNLMSNALKFGAGHPVTVRCTRSGETFHVDVSDQGIGVDSEDADRIFEEFGQTSAGRQMKGTGLGLSISRQLAQRLGGSLELVPSGAGATFRLTLPVAGPPS